jgi:type II secretory pathway component PulK
MDDRGLAIVCVICLVFLVVLSAIGIAIQIVTGTTP